MVRKGEELIGLVGLLLMHEGGFSSLYSLIALLCKSSLLSREIALLCKSSLLLSGEIALLCKFSLLLSEEIAQLAEE